jgi:Ca-activated chloride channel family protein
MESLDYYSILGIPRDASQEVIRKAYFKAARRLHPDRNMAPGDTEFFLGAKEAYEVLSDVKKRADYDGSLPSVITQEIPLTQRTIFSRDHLDPMQDPQLVYALVEFSPTIAGRENIPSPPLNICLLIDRSTSMKGVNLDIVKSTSIKILRQIRAQDTFALVAFSDRAEILISSIHQRDSVKLEARINMLQASGGTEIFNGLKTAFDEIRRSYKPTSINHIILLTDGRTYGDEKSCLELADEAIRNGVVISGLGIGHEWNDTFLDELARRTGGSSFYVSHPQDIHNLLMEKFNHLGEIFAEDISIDFQENKNVELSYVFRLAPEPGLLSTENPLHPGPVLRNGCLRLLLEFLVRGIEDANVIELMDGHVKVNLLDQAIPNPTLSLHLSRPVKMTTIIPEPPPQEIIQALSQLSLYKLQERAHADVAEGKYLEAANRLQRMATNLLELGERELARTVLLEAEHIKEKQAYSAEGDKRIKYGTRALLLPGKSGKRP